MGRHTDPRGKVNRALGTPIYESAGAVRALERRPRPPGMHTRPRRTSPYGQALNEKRKIMHYYGLRERQLLRLFDRARRRLGNTGEELLILCERRLDNVIRRAGLASTRPQARQGIVHGHFRVNGRKVDIPSFLVEVGDVISVRHRPQIQALYRGQVDLEEPPTWLEVDKDNLRVTVTALPGPEDISVPVEVARVVELLSRRA